MSNPWHPENGQQPPQPDWERWEAEHGPPPLELVERPAPVDVETARHLWWTVALLGMANLLITMIVVYGDRSIFAQQLVDDVKAQDSSVPLTLDSAQTYLTVALVILVLIGAGFAMLFVLVVKKMRLGKFWARSLLTMIGTLIVILTIPQLFGFGVDGDALQIVMGVGGILQGLLAAGAIYLMHRTESNAYFISARRP